MAAGEGFDDGFEPQVGEVRAIRTFRVGPGGLLYPLFGRTPWVAGPNRARCRADEDADHRAPDPECTCGFYAYSDEKWAGEYPYARSVLAVVCCWGRIITGTRGLRAEYARIEALWLGPEVPSDLVDGVRTNYPDVQLYERREEMLRGHPATPLEGAEPADAPTPPRIVTRSVAALAVVAGILPASWITGVSYGWWLEGALFAVLALAVLAGGWRSSDPAAQRRRLGAFALLLWMAAPFVGAAGVLFLRLPLIQLVALTLAHRMALARAARTFPARI